MTVHPIRVGVVGLGAFGQHHARHYDTNPNAELVAVVDIDGHRAGEIARRHRCAAVGYPRDLIGLVDAVSIAVPASLHHAVTAPLIDAGVHALIEKPVAVTAWEARDLCVRADRSGAIVQAGHIERFSPATDELLSRVKNPRRISAVRHAMWNGRADDVDVILDLMIHDIDLVLTLANAAPVSVAGNGVVLRSGQVDEAEAWLTFASGLIATLSTSRVAERNERKLTITDGSASYSADLAAPRLSVTSRSRWRSPSVDVALPARDNLAAEIDAFLAAIATGETPVVDGRAGLAAVEVAERIQAAIVEANAPALRSATR